MCKYLNIQLEDTMAFGDADNDIEMLNIVENGIGMKNAKCDLKTKKVTQFTNNEDGVARFLEDMMNDEFIENLPNKYDEIVEENNNNLSVGQKQRLAIARAILKDTPIILFDEVTSSLDKSSKIQIEKAIEKISKIKTIIVITHTLDSVENFDNILVIENGRISEHGSHAKLLSEKGTYYGLANL